MNQGGGGSDSASGRSRMIELLQEGRRRERDRTSFYRGLAAEADLSGEHDLANRLNGLLADEQHHLSRLTARLLEMGVRPEETPRRRVQAPPLEAWEKAARTGETEEVRWYEEALRKVDDPETMRVLQEILESEKKHLEVLDGKWMQA